jgi:hypothetical protein
MKTIGNRTTAHKKGFSEELNKFLELTIEFRKQKTFIPRGVYKFRTFEEMEKWRHRMLRGKKPDLQQ